MLSARLVNAVACRSYTAVFGGLTLCYLVAGSFLLWWATFGFPHLLFGQPLQQPLILLKPHMLYMGAGFLGFLAVVAGTLAVFTWMRSVVAVSIAFALWAFVAGANTVSQGGGIAAHPVAIFGTAVLALLLVIALATRRRANLPLQAA